MAQTQPTIGATLRRLALIGALGVVALGIVGFLFRDTIFSRDLTVVDDNVADATFAGPWQTPFACTADLLRIGSPGASCDVASSSSLFGLGASGARTLSDLGQTNGAETPVWFETGVLGRAAYRIAVPVGPAGTEPFDNSAWNGRLVYLFGGGCGAGFGQGIFVGANDPGDWIAGPAGAALDAGYAVATSTLNYFANSCNDVVSAAAALGVIDHFSATIGEPVVTLGSGGSGGSMAMFMIAQNYPGLLDGIVATLPFPDWLTVMQNAYDCRLLETFYGTEIGEGFSAEQQAAINGHASAGTCQLWDDSEDIVDMSLRASVCPFWVAEAYDADTAPDGVRCTVFENNRNQLGATESGAVRRPLDNVGVPYGLDALTAEIISVDQFLDLNEQIGGFDADGNVVADRTVADDGAVAAAYSGGRVLQGPGLGATPAILVRTDLDQSGDIHTLSWANSIRARVGDDAALVMWGAVGTDPGLAGEALRVVDAWATSVRNDGVAGDAEAVIERRPVDAVDLCVRNDQILAQGPDVFAPGQPCAEAMPSSEEPRTAAGAPIANDVLKCELVDADADAFGVALTADQAERLRSVFSSGVCDYTQPGIDQQPPTSPWQTYES